MFQAAAAFCHENERQMSASIKQKAVNAVIWNGPTAFGQLIQPFLGAVMARLPVPHLQKAYSDHGWKAEDFPINEAIHTKVQSLVGPHLAEKQIQWVANTVRAFQS